MMGREVRRVPADWEHPKKSGGSYVPLYDGYGDAWAEFEAMVAAEGLKEAVGWFSGGPLEEDYMPDWSEEKRTHWQMYETCSEGTPISPVMETPEKLARWLAENEASAFGSRTATYEQWLATIQRGSTISAVLSPTCGMMSGVEFEALLGKERKEKARHDTPS